MLVRCLAGLDCGLSAEAAQEAAQRSRGGRGEHLQLAGANLIPV
jgi:hypothetical protein